MNVLKEEAAISATSVTSAASTVATASRTTISHSIATSAPSARAAISQSSAECTSLLAGVGRRGVLQAVRAQPVLGNLSTTATEGGLLSSVLNNSASSESTALRNILPELREQISNAAQQGFEETVGDQMPRFEPTWGVAETVKQLEEVAAAR
ncbi:hypothetical protein FRC07_010912 [Ceratobasidium sp. 392]|nr:hypothetical protein FRC07_010912 [Ceratobasidium sp. 392]